MGVDFEQTPPLVYAEQTGPRRPEALGPRPPVREAVSVSWGLKDKSPLAPGLQTTHRDSLAVLEVGSSRQGSPARGRGDRQQGRLLPEAPGENPFPGLFRLLQVPAHLSAWIFFLFQARRLRRVLLPCGHGDLLSCLLLLF